MFSRIMTRRFRIFSDCPKQPKDRFLSVTNTTPVKASVTSTTIPSVTSTTIPSVTSTTIPSVTSTTIPSVTSTTIPSVTSTTIPSVTSTTIPSVTSTTIPSVTSTTIPSVTSTVPDPESIEPTITKKGSDTELSFVENWKRTSSLKRKCIGLYAAGVAVTFAVTIYEDGRNALEHHRRIGHYCPTAPDNSRLRSNISHDPGCECDLRRFEYYAVKKECDMSWFSRFCGSIFFPHVVMSSAISHMILFAVPDPTHNQEPREPK